MGRKKAEYEKELERKINELHKAGKTYHSIQEILNCSPSTIAKYIKKDK